MNKAFRTADAPRNDSGEWMIYWVPRSVPNWTPSREPILLRPRSRLSFSRYWTATNRTPIIDSRCSPVFMRISSSDSLPFYYYSVLSILQIPCPGSIALQWKLNRATAFGCLNLAFFYACNHSPRFRHLQDTTPKLAATPL